MDKEEITLLELNQRIGAAITAHPGTQQVWVTAELSDVSCKNGHTYMELIHKDAAGSQVAKARAMIWKSRASEVERFERTTGQKFTSGIKLKVLASATMHPLFGLSLLITQIDPEYTMGDLLRRRREILQQLTADGVINVNKQLACDPLSLRVAVISSPEAAGYGDFMNHLHTSGIRFRFQTRLFPSIMQGDRTVPGILNSLALIEQQQDQWDCVVIIRGGGATSDLAAFESYELAYRVATFELPIIIGIGHERDITVLDYVANMRVKTPTAAADWLINRWEEQLSNMIQLSQTLTGLATDKVNAEKIHLGYLDTNLTNLSRNAVTRSKARFERNALILATVNTRRIAPAKDRLKACAEKMEIITANVINRQRTGLDNKSHMLEALSPASVLKRGFSMTTVNGRCVKSIHDIKEHGTEITTVFIDGEIKSKTI